MSGVKSADHAAELDAAAVRHRRVMIEVLVQHPDVWEAIAEHARERVAGFPRGSVECSVLLRLAAVAPDVAAMLQRMNDSAWSRCDSRRLSGSRTHRCIHGAGHLGDHARSDGRTWTDGQSLRRAS